MKTLNYLTVFIGFLLLLGGVLKSIDKMPEMSLNLGDASLNFGSMNSLFYNVVINMIGGSALIFHAIITLRFKRKLLLPNKAYDITIEHPNVSSVLAEKWVIISGLILIGVSAWECIYTLFLLSTFGSRVFELIGLFIFTIIIFVPFSIIPLILVSKNFSLYNEIVSIRKKQALIKIHETLS